MSPLRGSILRGINSPWAFTHGYKNVEPLALFSQISMLKCIIFISKKLVCNAQAQSDATGFMFIKKRCGKLSFTNIQKVQRTTIFVES